MYPVNVEALNTVFSPYGFVQKIAIFEKNGQTQVRLAVVTYKGSGADAVCQRRFQAFLASAGPCLCRMAVTLCPFRLLITLVFKLNEFAHRPCLPHRRR